MTARILVIPNDTASTTRVNINDALAALGSTNSGATEPPDSLNNMLWYDTTNHLLKMKAEVGADWISIGYLDQGSDTFKILDDTVVTTAAGADTNGVIGDQTTATWQAGTGTTQSLVSPENVKAAILALAPPSPITTTSGSAPYYGCRAWGKVSSDALVDGGNFASWNTSTHVVTFTTAMPHANYSVNCNSSAFGATYARNMTTTSFEVVAVSSGGSVGSPTSFEFTVIC